MRLKNYFLNLLHSSHLLQRLIFHCRPLPAIQQKIGHQPLLKSSSVGKLSLYYLFSFCSPIHNVPSSQCSFFQMGTISLIRSIAYLLAAKASFRCGVETAMATATSEMSNRPLR